MNSRSQKQKIRRVLHIAREFGPIAGAGGIKDVTWGLSRASAEKGIAVAMVLPHYRKVDAYLARHQLNARRYCTFLVPMNYGSYAHPETVVVSSCKISPKLTLYLIKADPFQYLAEMPEQKIPRQGIYQYTKDEAAALGRPLLEGQGYSDAFAQNVLLVKSALMLLAQVSWRPDIVHCHDGHAALFPLIAQCSEEGYAPSLAHIPTLLTLHNAGSGYHQETQSLDYAQAICGLSSEKGKTLIPRCTLNEAFDPLLAGAVFGTAVNTVSENYARELRETGLDAKTGWLGHAYTGLGIELLGITNGIDVASHHPGSPLLEGLPVPFFPEKKDWEGKAQCKQQSIEAINRFKTTNEAQKYGTIRNDPEAVLFTFVGRLTLQKGFGDLYEALSLLLKEERAVSLLGLGNGSPEIVKQFIALTQQFKGRVCFIDGYSEENAHRIFAAGDFFLIPSQYEPCGLTDFIAQLNGNIPIVHQVGGLVKTVDAQTGFSYLGGKEELLLAMKRAIKVYRTPGKKQLRSIQLKAIQNIYSHFTWEKVLEEQYLPLYHQVINKTKPTLPGAIQG